MNATRLYEAIRKLLGRGLTPSEFNAVEASMRDDSTLQPSGACVQLVKQFEGLRLTAYKCPADIPTIGYGSTKGVRMGMTISAADADARLRDDLKEAAEGVLKALGGAATSQGQFDGLVSFAFNLGVRRLEGSTLLRKHKAGDFAGAAAEFPRWKFAAGQILPGLVRRRAAERKLYEAAA